VTSVVIVPATHADVDDINRIYNAYILGSHVSFDTEPWTHGQRERWLDECVTDGYPVFVARDGRRVVGAAWSGPWRRKPAYASSIETTIVLARAAIGLGIGSRLYRTMIDELVDLGFHRCYAVIALPNDRSVEFHRAFGYRDVGVLDEVGLKDGVFVSTLLLELRI
jgi:phosphinothricin acetyltransferase